MTRRRGNGEGSVFKEPSGRYRIAVSVWVNGKRKQVTRTAWKHADALAILTQMKQENAVNTLSSDRITFGDFLQKWLDDVVAHSRAPTTVSNYRNSCRTHLIPLLGRVKLRELSPLHVQGMLSDMIRSKKGPNAKKAAHRIGRTACSYAVKMGLIQVNPFSRVESPKYTQQEMRPFTLAQCKAMMDDTVGTRLHALLVVALTTGMRQGELHGMQWSKIDWQHGTVRIDQQVVAVDSIVELAPPKTPASIRTVCLPPVAMDALKAHRAILMKEGNAGSPMVFPSPAGKLMRRTNFTRLVWVPFLRRMGIEHRGFHNTRHTYATHALANGIAAVVVARQLGHARASTTQNVYSHAIKEHQTEAVNKIQKLFG